MKQTVCILAFIIVIGIILIGLTQDQLAEYAWGARQPALALALGGGNAQTAMQLGDISI